MTALPRWLTAPNAADANYSVEPTEAKKDVGFDAGEKLPAQYVNWFMSSIEKYLREKLDTGTALIPAMMGQPEVPPAAETEWQQAVSASGVYWFTTAAAGSGRDIAFPISLPLGKRIGAVRGYVRAGGTAAVAISMLLIKTTTAGIGSQIGSTQTSTTASTDQTLTLGSLAETIATGSTYHVMFSSGISTGQRVYAVEVDFDTP